MNEIKIGRKVFQIYSDDYILDNGACFQFIAGDGRTLYVKNWSRYTSIVIPKTVLKKIDLAKMRTVQTGNKEERTLMVRYFFKKEIADDHNQEK